MSKTGFLTENDQIRKIMFHLYYKCIEYKICFRKLKNYFTMKKVINLLSVVKLFIVRPWLKQNMITVISLIHYTCLIQKITIVKIFVLAN